MLLEATVFSKMKQSQKILLYFLCLLSLQSRQIHKDRKQGGGCQGLWEGEASSVQWSLRFQEERRWRCMVVMAAQEMNGLDATHLCTKNT